MLCRIFEFKPFPKKMLTAGTEENIFDSMIVMKY